MLCIAWYWRGSCAVYLDDFDRGRVDAGLGIDAAREAGSVLGELLNLRMLSEVLAKTGEGEGATFRIALPLAPEAVGDPDDLDAGDDAELDLPEVTEDSAADEIWPGTQH